VRSSEGGRWWIDIQRRDISEMGEKRAPAIGRRARRLI
jgi:hypothetical protein